VRVLGEEPEPGLGLPNQHTKACPRFQTMHCWCPPATGPGQPHEKGCYHYRSGFVKYALYPPPHQPPYQPQYYKAGLFYGHGLPLHPLPLHPGEDPGIIDLEWQAYAQGYKWAKAQWAKQAQTQAYAGPFEDADIDDYPPSLPLPGLLQVHDELVFEVEPDAEPGPSGPYDPAEAAQDPGIDLE
jgi:hypothetical protein